MSGIVLEASAEEVILDVGAKRDAFVPRTDMDRLDDETLAQVGPGAEIKVYVLQPRSRSGDLIVSIHKALALRDWDRATALEASGEIIEAQVAGVNRGGLLVDFGRLRGFVPNSHITDIPRGASEDQQQKVKQELVGKMLSLKVIEVNQQRNRLVLSERTAQQALRMERMSTLKVGEIVDGLIHISQMDWKFVEHPSDVLSAGDEVEVLVEEIDRDRERISLNRKAVLPSPWKTVADDYQVGDVATGTVRGSTEFGVFVELPNGLIGLVHVSEMASYNITDPREWAREGAELLVRVISIDTQEERIGLSLDAITSDELYGWMVARGEAVEEPQTAEIVEQAADETQVSAPEEQVAELLDEIVGDAPVEGEAEQAVS
jgi:small subunit ribosomal protein S1